MKVVGVVFALTILGAASAGAVDIQGKWGIGAGVIERGGELSLIRGRSERSAWLFDVAIFQRDDAYRTEFTPPQPPPVSGNSNRISIQAGPGYRRFARPAEDFSPYWDIHVRGLFDREHFGGSSSATRTMAGAEGEFSFGLEYFTRRHFSVAAHSSLASLSWTHVSERQSQPGTGIRTTGHHQSASIALSPAIFVRGYF